MCCVVLCVVLFVICATTLVLLSRTLHACVKRTWETLLSSKSTGLKSGWSVGTVGDVEMCVVRAVLLTVLG